MGSRSGLIELQVAGSTNRVVFLNTADVSDVLGGWIELHREVGPSTTLQTYCRELLHGFRDGYQVTYSRKGLMIVSYLTLKGRIESCYHYDLS
jgi:hypothetical protein